MKPRPITSDVVKEQLTEMILSGELAPGSILREGELAEHFGVSRTPIREAIRQVAASGLILLRPRQRSIVNRFKLGEVIDRFETMAALESACAELAAARRTQADLAEIRLHHDECARMESGGQLIGYYEANERFHEAIYWASGNAHLASETMSMRNTMRVLRIPRTSQPQRMGQSFREHARICEAIGAQDEAEARAAMRDHVIMQGATLRALVDRYEGMTDDPSGQLAARR